jgi:hypothetical protein
MLLRKDGKPDRRQFRAKTTNWKAERLAWRDMWKRCTVPYFKQYKDYGGRGIRVCKRWEKFENFFTDMGPRPAGMTLDRIDNSKGYSSANCRWASRREQAMSRRTTVVVMINGVARPFKEWCKVLGLDYRAAQSRVYRGMSHYDALTKPWRAPRCRHRRDM